MSPEQYKTNTLNPDRLSPEVINSAITELQSQLDGRIQMGADFVKKKYEDLERRLRGEITGVELDRLNAEDDNAIEYNYAEMKRLWAQMRETIELLSDDVPETEESPVLPTLEATTSIVEAVDAEVPAVKEASDASLYVEDLKVMTSIREVTGLIARHGDIIAPDGYIYKKEEQIGVIGSLTDSSDPNLQRVTNTHGLRDRVKLILMKSELDAKKYRV